MTEDVQKKLYTKYPKIFRQKDLPMNQTCMCWGIDTGDGWHDIIDALCANLETYMNNKLNTYEYKKSQGEEVEEVIQIEATQVKEKFGGLRFYTNYTDEYIDGLIDMATSMSYRTCDTCGNSGRPNKSGWIVTLCSSCRKSYNKKRDIVEEVEEADEETV